MIGNVDTASGFCKLKSNDQSPISQIQTQVLDGTGIITMEPQPTWLTPLADGLCRSVSKVWASAQGPNKTLILESDAGENSSLATRCLGPAATNNNDADTTNDINSWTDLTKTVADWRYVPTTQLTGAWEANVLRRVTRVQLFNPSSISAADSLFDTQELGAVNNGPLASSNLIPPLLSLRVSVHYTLCAPGDSDAVCLLNDQTTLQSQFQAQALIASAAAAPALRTDRRQRSSAPASFAAFAAPASAAAAAPAAAPAVVRTPTIDPSELGFFRALGTAPKAKLREVVRDPSVVFGVSHKIAGDVDDSNCTDRADFNIIMQKDIWLQRAVRPLELAIRADLNRDGWVDEADRAIVLANWGKGCINNPGPKPKI